MSSFFTFFHFAWLEFKVSIFLIFVSSCLIFNLCYFSPQTINAALKDEASFFQKNYPALASRNGTPFLARTLNKVSRRREIENKITCFWLFCQRFKALQNERIHEQNLKLYFHCSFWCTILGIVFPTWSHVSMQWHRNTSIYYRVTENRWKTRYIKWL